MKPRTVLTPPAAFALLCALLTNLGLSQSSRVSLLRTPDGGIQPQAVVDDKGAVHLIYYKGAASGGDVFYVRQEPGKSGFSKPQMVNVRRGSAIATGTIRGAQLAIGKNGRVHVAWNGGQGAARAMINGKETTPLLYTRLNDAGTGFEPERNLLTFAAGLDGGGSVAADASGNVYVAWHAFPPGNTNGEAGRAVFVAHSADEGATFAPEKPAVTRPTGACACCGMKALAASSGAVCILFRAAGEKVNRDETLLLAPQPGADFAVVNLHKWRASICPMSSAFLAEGKGNILAAWETGGQIYHAAIDPKTMEISKPLAPPGGASRKHPLAIANAGGEVLVAWVEGTGWAKGGSLAWQLYGREGKPAEKGRAEGVPVWSLATAYAKPDGNFVIVY